MLLQVTAGPPAQQCLQQMKPVHGQPHAPAAHLGIVAQKLRADPLCPAQMGSFHLEAPQGPLRLRGVAAGS